MSQGVRGGQTHYRVILQQSLDEIQEFEVFIRGMAGFVTTSTMRPCYIHTEIHINTNREMRTDKKI